MQTRISSRSIIAAVTISAVGLALGSASGGWVLAVVMGLLSGGTAAVIIGTAKWAIQTLGRKVAIA